MTLPLYVGPAMLACHDESMVVVCGLQGYMCYVCGLQGYTSDLARATHQIVQGYTSELATNAKPQVAYGDTSELATNAKPQVA
jgi:hypothetical protein